MDSADLRLLMTVGGMLVSVVSAFVIVKTKLSGVIEQISDIEHRIRKMDTRIDVGEVSRSTVHQRVDVLSSMLSPSARQQMHERLATMESGISHLRKDADKLLALHNGKHP